MTLLSYAFRPFFLLNGLFAAAVVFLWALVLAGNGPEFLPANLMLWHGHEMIVGFAMTAVAGFLMTAVAVWTGRPPLSGALLAGLVLSWLAGRAVMLGAGVLPTWVVGVVDSWFPVMLFVLITREVLVSRNRRNYPIAAIAGLLAVLNVLYHLGSERVALFLFIHIVLLLVTIIGGRIIPSFTANWLRTQGAERLPGNNVALDNATFVATFATGIGVSVAPANMLTGILALLTAGLHAWRLSAWCGLAARKNPLLLILHIAYAWLPLGYLLTGLVAIGLPVPATSALHALTMGAIGTMILAMTTRVSLGHTGRPLQLARLTVLSYILLCAGVLARVVAPLAGGDYQAMVNVSAAGWILAFLLFTWVYWPILTKERAV